MTGDGTASAPGHAPPQGGRGLALLAPTAATTVVYTPSLLFQPTLWENVPGYVSLVWLAVLISAAPVTAALVNRRRPVAVTHPRSWLLGLPQLPLVLGLAWFDIWLDVRSGYLLPGYEVEVALGFGTIMAAGFGLLLTVLVNAASVIGAARHTS